MAKSEFTSILKSKWLPATEESLNQVALEMATDVHRVAQVLAPKDTRNLVNSGRIEPQSQKGRYHVVFGGEGNGFVVPYAKRRHYENKKNPKTLRYLEKAGEAVARGTTLKYFPGGGTSTAVRPR